MICVETIGKIRRWHRVDKLSISKIARRLSALAQYDSEVPGRRGHHSRGTSTRPKRAPVMGAWVEKLEAMLAEDAQRPRKEQRTAQRLLRCAGAGRFHRLVSDGATRSSRRGTRSAGIARARVFIPQSFAPGEAYQFDWSYETVDLGGRPTPVKVAHLRLCHSRVFLAVAYLREAQEMVFDAHWRAFSLWGGSCQRGIYDNLKTAVELIFTGKARQYNRKFLQMASHYLIEPVACTPAAGWEKGQVENQVGHVRENMFTPRLRCADLAELNALLERRCVADGASDPAPRAARADPLGSVRGVGARAAGAAGGPVRGLRRTRGAGQLDGAGARRSQPLQRRLPLRGQDGVAAHLRRADRGRGRRARSSASMCAASSVIAPSSIPGTTWRRWRRSPGRCATARRSRTGRCRRRCWRCGIGCVHKAGGDRQFVTILATIAEDGIEAVNVACELALEANAISDSYVLNALNRFKPQPAVEVVVAPTATAAQGGAQGRCRALRPAAEETRGGGDRGDADVDGGGVESRRRCPMERHDMLLKLKALKLHGMVAAFDEVIDEGIKRSRTPFDVLGRLLAAEDAERHARSIRYQMTGAKFPEYRELANFEFAESPVNEQQIRTLHDGGFTEETRNIVLVGGPGTGKSHLGLALAIQAVKTQPPRALLQRRRPGQPARTGEGGRQAGSPRAAAHPHRCRRDGRTRVFARQRQRRRAAVSPDLETLREDQPDHHHQPVVLGVGARCSAMPR